jgi:hypothetical protein
MGEKQNNLFEPDFNHSIKVQSSDHRLTSTAGVLLLREAESKLGLIDSVADSMHDPRRQDRIRYCVAELLRERVFAMAIGASAQDDLDRLAHDPSFRAAVWDRKGDEVIQERLASQPTQSRLLSLIGEDSNNLQALRGSLALSVERHVLATGSCRVRHATIDIDSFPIETHGQQHGSAYNGYYRKSVYHPLVASLSVAGDYDSSFQGLRQGNGFLNAILRQGQVHTADGVGRFLDSTLKSAEKIAMHVDVRLDAGYTFGAVMDDLSVRSCRFVGRLKGNKKLDQMAQPHLHRPVGRPPAEGYQKVIELGSYQPDSWSFAQRLILVVVDQPDAATGQLNLLPRYFFLVTNWSQQARSGQQLLDHYRQRGTFEDRLGEFNGAIGVHLSSSGFKENEVTMLMALLAFNLNSICRSELEDEFGNGWDLKRFQLFVLLVGGRWVKHSRRLVLRIAESASPLWSGLAQRIASWRLPWVEDCSVSRPVRRGFMPPPSHSHHREVLRC